MDKENFDIKVHKMREKCHKIYSFLEQKYPKEMYAILTDYYVNESFITLASENFTTEEGLKKDYKNFPWIPKIYEKRKELFGF